MTDERPNAAAEPSVPAGPSDGGALSVLVVRMEAAWEPGLFERMLALAPPEKREQTLRYRRREDAQRTLLADMMARVEGARRLGVAPSAVRLAKDGYGKPYFADAPGLHLSVTHAGDYAGVALGGAPCGLDIEQLADVDPAIGRSVYSDAEMRALLALDGEARRSRFFDLWTLKESYSKAVGRGLSMPLREVTLLPGQPGETFRYADAGGVYYFRQYGIDESYKCSVCAQTADFPDTVEPVPLRVWTREAWMHAWKLEGWDS